VNNNNEIKCCKCGKKLATFVDGEIEFRGVNIDWVRITQISETEKTTKYKCRGCYAVNSIKENQKPSIDDKEIAKDLIYNFKKKKRK